MLFNASMRRTIQICLILAVSLAFARQAAARRPNVIVFLTDDQGWGDLSINGNSNLSTPNVDSLARGRGNRHWVWRGSNSH